MRLIAQNILSYIASGYPLFLIFLVIPCSFGNVHVIFNSARQVYATGTNLLLWCWHAGLLGSHQILPNEMDSNCPPNHIPPLLFQAPCDCMRYIIWHLIVSSAIYSRTPFCCWRQLTSWPCMLQVPWSLLAGHMERRKWRGTEICTACRE